MKSGFRGTTPTAAAWCPGPDEHGHAVPPLMRPWIDPEAPLMAISGSRLEAVVWWPMQVCVILV